MPSFEYLALSLPLLVIAFTVHEFGHAWVALKQGDDTAYQLGRVTLNPAAHIDPVGSLLLPAIAMMTGAPLLGWAKPVPVTPRKFRSYKRGDLLTSAAGVAGNLVLIFAFALLGALAQVALHFGIELGRTLQIVAQMCYMGGQLNAALIIFNLIPIPPLDGSRIIVHFLSPRAHQAYAELARYGMMLLWGLVIFRALNFIWPAADALNGLVVSLVNLPFVLLLR